MSNAVPCAGVVKPSPIRRNGNATVEALSLVVIWPGSWYIVSTPSNSPLKALMKIVSVENGLRQSMLAAAGMRDGGRDDVDSVAAEQAVLPACGSAPRRNARPGDSCAAHCAVGEARSRSGRGLVERGSQRDVRGHPRIQAVEDVHPLK
jgi:hypothetical protein